VIFCAEESNLVVAELFQILHHALQVWYPQCKSSPRIKKGGQLVQVKVPVFLSKVFSHLNIEVVVERASVTRENVLR